MFRQWVAEQKLKDLGTFLYRLQNQAIMIRLDVSDAKDAFKLFETINNRGLRLSPPDIIKNFLLGNAARFDAKSLNLAKASWARLVKDLDGVNFEAFFRYFLTAKLKRRITRSFVIANFKQLFMTLVAEAAKLPERHWYLEDEGEDDEVEAVEDNPDGVDVAHSITLPEGERVPFDTFMGDLTRSATIYGQLVRCNTGNPSIDRHLRNLRMISASQSYGFLMYLRTGECKDSEFKKVLKLTEAFLMRRHTCRLRSNDTERVFARLCSADPTAILEKVREVYREFSPSDEKFIEDFAAINFNSNIIDRARYCLEQFEFDNQGSHAELAVAGADTVHVEHIIPQKIKTHKAKDEFGDWPSYLGESAEAKHGKFVSKIGNLTLFAGALNIGASNNPYSRKAVAYEQSAIKMTNELPKKYEEFRYAEVDKRSRELANEPPLYGRIPRH